MPTKKRTKKPATYKVLRGFDYPASLAIRDRIYAGERIPRAEQGELKMHEVGDKITNLPSDVLRSLLRRGAVEPSEQKEVSSDTPK